MRTRNLNLLLDINLEMLKNSVVGRAYTCVRVLGSMLLPGRQSLIQRRGLVIRPLLFPLRSVVFVAFITKVDGLGVTAGNLIDLLNIHVVSVQLLHLRTAWILVDLVGFGVLISVL